ncbi:MAG: rod shape-determining protein RodA [Bacteroidetes bacterium]|nr:rod shape-determining protein RodA [Bacteroidota bacterium]MCL2301973.1 rod shape-determining protein RodA [Lentimicrobiaceae bacterium]
MLKEVSFGGSNEFDIRLILYYLALISIGWITIFSTSYNPAAEDFFSLGNAYTRQLIFIGSSFVIAILILLLKGQYYSFLAYPIYLFCLLVMILVLFIGTEISGAHAWIKIGSFSIQPTEFCKFATALALAKFFTEGKTLQEKKNTWLVAFVIVLFPVLIIMLQKDTGSALVFSSFIFLLYRIGLTGWILVTGGAAIALFLITLYWNEVYAIALVTTIFVVFWILNRKNRRKLIRNATIYGLALVFIVVADISYNNVLQPHQKMRIDTLLGKVNDPQGADFNLNQSKIAIGSGGWIGKGYRSGTQTKLNFVPEQHTDFIFCGIGEEWGFAGSLIVCLLLSGLVLRILRLSERQRDPFTKYYGYGIAGVIFFHFFINIGMTIGLLPIIGIPLPLISYGGSSLWAFTIMIFVFIKLDYR